MTDVSETKLPNHLLSTLPAEESRRLAAHLEPVSLELSRVLFRPDESITHAYFPTTAIISLLTDLEDGTGMEVGLVGREGVVGVSIILGGTETKVATVQGAGEALRLRADVLREEFGRGGAFQAALLRYTHALMTQISQSVVCNTRHRTDGRLARWILMYADRSPSSEFYLTHEFMANMLGVRRASVTEIANSLQERGLITYQRGHVTLLDRAGLEQFACECYPAVKQKFEEFLM